MARMLGRARTRLIDPRDDEWFTDATGARRGQRHRERQELRELAPVADDEWLAAIDPLIDPSDCRHGCNGDCIVLGSGSDVCDFLCHPGLTTDPVRAERLERKLREMGA